MVITTESNISNAQRLAKEILNRKYASCIGLREINSYYWWEDKIENSSEFQLQIKTNKKNLDNLLFSLSELHTYKNPEIIFWEVNASYDFEQWNDKVTV